MAKAPQTPGSTETDSQQEGAADAAQAEPTVAIPVSQLNALLDRVERLERRGAIETASGTKPDEADLPDASEIDANEIKRAVLTKQGWVVPPKLGAHPALR